MKTGNKLYYTKYNFCEISNCPRKHIFIFNKKNAVEILTKLINNPRMTNNK